MLFSAFKYRQILLSLLLLQACTLRYRDRTSSIPADQHRPSLGNQNRKVAKIKTGAAQTKLYFPLLRNKRIGVVANQSALIVHTHLVDSLLQAGLKVVKIFCPEHGFRGQASAGAPIKDGEDPKTGLPVFSLYGKNKKPTTEQLQDIDILLFDIQDVGVRFYTYLSTLHYVMEAAAEQHIPLLLLDRPNPNAAYVDGPVLEMKNKSFVGMDPVPIVYGMTIGEYAEMINGEHWLEAGVQAELTVIPLAHYNHKMQYDLPVRPSPNLPNAQAVSLYPTLCLFEGTSVSVGRGTDFPFQAYGAPYLKGAFSFTPHPNRGADKPKCQDVLCHGRDLRTYPLPLQGLKLSWLIQAYRQAPDKAHFFRPFFTKLAGTRRLEEDIKNGLSETQIKAHWQAALNAFKKVRAQYLIY